MPEQHAHQHPPSAPAPTRSLATHGDFHLRPRYCECDPMGVVHHASYIPWLEMGRTELLRSTGLSYAQLEAQGVLLVIVKLDVKYRRPARYDDLLEVRTRVTGGSRVKIEHAYEIALIASASAGPDTPPTPSEHAPVLLVATTTLACVDRQGVPQALPAWLTAGGLTSHAG